MKELLIGLFPEKLGKVLCGFVSQKDMDLAGMAAIIKDFELPVTDSLSYAQSQVCQGGVDTKLVDSNTMESKLCPGLYFAGELLDIDGTCGGYNLQWAWTSGAVAGIHASKKEVFE
jgi:predicted flavoprotein YhiN